MIGYAGAFIGGLLTLLSPCSALLLPAFFAYAFSTPTRLVLRTGIFYLGLLSTLVPLGVFAGVFGSLITQHRDVLISVAAGLVILVGLAQIVGVHIPAFSRTVAQAGSSRLSVFVLGAVYGVAGVCTGPILGSILTISAVGGNALYGGILLAIYALGMAVPLFVLALFWDRLGIAGRQWLRPRRLTIGRWSNSSTTVLAGLLSLGIGILLLATNGTAGINSVLTVSDQFALENAASAGASGMSNSLFTIGALASLGAAVILYLRSQRPPIKEPTRDDLATIIPPRETP